MDFAFGTLSTSALKLYHHRLKHQGIRHGHEISPQKPVPHQPITLFATTGTDFSASHVACYYTTDGTRPSGSKGDTQHGQIAHFSPIKTIWDNFEWGYVTRWSVTLPGFPKGTRLRYKIGAWDGENPESYADFPDLKQSAEHAAHRHFSLGLAPDANQRWGNPHQGTIFTINIGQAGAPDWAKEAIIYHLMPDRFYPGEAREWQQITDLTRPMGGTLQGVLEKLDYLATLGINTLWMSPIWQTPSWHGYDTADFMAVEPRLGNKEVLKRLIGQAHNMGIRVIFDMACNHISNRHPVFEDALHNSRSAYRDWFTFDESELGYQGFFGVESMPEINLTHPDARDWMVENALYWLREFDIDGYRLDYANGARPDFWSFFVDACKQVKPDTFYFGEIIDSPDMLQAYVGRLDGALDFHINHALRQTYAWGNWTEDDFNRFLHRHRQTMPSDFLMPTFIDNHDMDRFTFISDNHPQAQQTALDALFRLPNPPVLLYGTEVGLTQNASTQTIGLDAVREPMPWGQDQDLELLEQTKAAILARKRSNSE